MSSPPHGFCESIVACRLFLKEVHRQVAALLRSLDGLFSNRGWTPTNRPNVTWGLGPALNPDRWLVDYLYRYYLPPGGARDRISGVFIYLELPEVGGYTSPVCFAFAVKFGQPLVNLDFDKSWETDDVMRALNGVTTPRALTQEERDSFLPGTTAGEAFVIPLCEPTCEDDLQNRIVTPLDVAQGRL